MKRYNIAPDTLMGVVEHPEGSFVHWNEHEAIIRRQASAAVAGMDAATRISSRQLELARQARAESAPESLESERAANAKLTQELSLAEEGLANYAQEIANLRNELTAARLERDQFAKALKMIQDGEIPQAMSPALFAEFVLRGPAPHPTTD